MGDYDKQIESETYDLDSLAWLAHPAHTETWRERGWYTVLNYAEADMGTDEAVDFASAALADIWRL